MSYRVTDEFLSKSRSKHGPRMVGSVIAEIAHHDGVGWMLIAPSKAKRRRGEESIAKRANVNEKTVRRAIEKLQELDELEIVLARDRFHPRETFYVYRLTVGRIRQIEVDYARGLPVPEGTFWTQEQLLLPVSERPTDAHIFPSSDPRRADILSTRRIGDRGGDERTSTTETSGHPDRERADILTAGIHARESSNGPLEPSFGPVPAAEPPSLESRSKDQAELLPSLRQIPIEEIKTAAAASPAAAQLAAVVHVIETFRGWDIRSLRVVEPLAVQLPADHVRAAATKVKQRRNVANETGLFVSFLRDAIADLAAADQRQAQAALDEYERLKRDDPEAYVIAWARGGAAIVGGGFARTRLLEYLFEHVTDDHERERLTELFEAERTFETGYRDLRDWIVMRSHRYDPQTVQREIELLTAKAPTARAELLELATEIRANVDAAEGAA